MDRDKIIAEFEIVLKKWTANKGKKTVYPELLWKLAEILSGNQRASEGEETKKEYTIRKYQEYIKFVKDNKGGNGFVFWLEKESD